MVYPGAVHTRFQHAIGSMYLISLAIDVIRNKGHEITDEEAEASKIAILLHDIGHGPFSHALESCIISKLSHEELSLFFMQELNEEFGGKLTLAIKIFQNKYYKKFLHQLISGQLDMDRLDYLRRDTFFTGVTEGIVGSERIIKMLEVVDDNLVIEAKGIYSIEKFLIARRLMYWQVYFHKTVLVAENLLVKTLERIKELYYLGQLKIENIHFKYFLDNNSCDNKKEIVEHFSMLDDFDIIYLLKQNINSEDKILKMLCSGVLNRTLPKILIRKENFDTSFISNLSEKVIEKYGISELELKYFLYYGEISNNAYNENDEKINILYGSELKDITEASDMLNLSVLSKIVKKYYVCIPKTITNFL